MLVLTLTMYVKSSRYKMRARAKRLRDSVVLYNFNSPEGVNFKLSGLIACPRTWFDNCRFYPTHSDT